MDVVRIACLITYTLSLGMAVWSKHKRDIYDEVWYIGLAIVFASLDI